MGEGYAPKGFTDYVPGSGLPVVAEVEAGLGVYIGVGPAIQDNAGDILFRFKACILEDLLHLPHYQRLEFGIACSQELAPSAFSLFLNGKARLVEGNVEGEHGGLVRVQQWAVISYIHRLADIAAETEPAEPLAGSEPQPVKESPVGESHICY